MTRGRKTLLLADIGGTRARFIVVDADASPASALLSEQRLELRSAEFETIEALLSAALVRFGKPRLVGAVIAVAAPVSGGVGRFTNRPWRVDAAVMAEALGCAQVHVVNDLVAAARAVADDNPPSHVLLQQGEEGHARRHALISIGTGVGVAYWQPAVEAKRVPLQIDASEAGHTGFAPCADWQLEWLRALQSRFGWRVSWERVLCGDGLCLLDAWLRGKAPRHAADIVRRAQAGDAEARQTVQRYSELLGVFAGDTVLAAAAEGGAWLTGGVLQGLGDALAVDDFLQAFRHKGRMSERMQRIPVRWTRKPDLGLLGAWLHARDYLSVR